MDVRVLIGVLSLCACCVGQFHFWNSQSNSRTLCPKCSSTDANFPGCLYRTDQTCSPFTSCRFDYGKDGYNIHCAASCKEPQLDIETRVVTSSGLFCPGLCRPGQESDCLVHGVFCATGQYCDVMVKTRGGITVIAGYCRDQNLYASCQSNVTQSPCDTLLQGSNCKLACCTTNSCLQPHFRHFNIANTAVVSTTTQSPSASSARTMTTTTISAPATTPTLKTTSTTQQTTTTSSMFQKFETSCSDQLEQGACQSFQTSQQICHDRYTIQLCAESCGVCKAIHELNCHDTILNVGCNAMPGICDQPTGKHICPKTCGFCDSLIEAAVMDLVNGKTTATTTTTTTTTATENSTVSEYHLSSVVIWKL